MLATRQPDEILNEITENIKDKFGLKVFDAEINHFGYANLKWRIRTDSGVFFVKQYNSVRYSDELLQSVEVALELQDRLNKAGIPCPKILNKQGTYIHRTQSGERYMITEFCDGQMVNPGEINIHQMHNLGQITGRLHHWLNTNAPQSLPLHWKPDTKEGMLRNWSQNWLDAQFAGSNKYIAALEQQRKIADEINLEIFDLCEEGWVHWDLFVDNILFHTDKVTAILDFDRMNYIYPEFDISRAILSGAILDGSFNIESARAFINGYRQSIPITRPKLIRSIKLTWWKEASWINVKSEDHRTLKRFVDELIWVSNNWTMLEEVCNDLLV
ncbi:phosphotransferase [Cohnella sp.]|uniref:phosphotransferase n=1 Tax=Cohnella sp. TaxID=1883426 RepID=UPI003562BA47